VIEEFFHGTEPICLNTQENLHSSEQSLPIAGEILEDIDEVTSQLCKKLFLFLFYANLFASGLDGEEGWRCLYGRVEVGRALGRVQSGGVAGPAGVMAEMFAAGGRGVVDRRVLWHCGWGCGCCRIVREVHSCRYMGDVG
jgi:hypothetical protein